MNCHAIGFLAISALPLACLTQDTLADEIPKSVVKEFLSVHCSDCHIGESSDPQDPQARFNLEPVLDELNDSASPLAKHFSNIDDWVVYERIIKRVASGQMPPANETDEESLPTEARESFLQVLTQAIDNAAELTPRFRSADAVRRLNRTEYQNSVRDLLHLNVNVSDLLPADQAGHGFDNVTVGDLSPVLLSRYVAAAEKIARMAVGGSEVPVGFNRRLPADRTQDSHVDGLPLGTRGGTSFEYNFPASGEYEIQLRLMRDRDEKR